MNNNSTDSAKDNYKDNRNESGQPGSNSNTEGDNKKRVVINDLSTDEENDG
jgi:hypothetical protein